MNSSTGEKIKFPLSLQLKSDFRQYYDVWFENPANGKSVVYLERFMQDGFSRFDIFNLFRALKMKTPEYGFMVNEDILKYPVILYENNFAHAGEGKRLVLTKCTISDSGKLYAEYHRTSPVASSYRYLKIGEQEFYLSYSSDDEFRSNCGDVTINLLDSRWASLKFGSLIPRDHALLNLPLYAIDFIEDFESGEFFAIDFNSAPGIDRTPIQDLYPGEKVFQWILDWYKKNYQDLVKKQK